MQILTDIEQGSAEWLALRKTKITATDASVIMNANPWKTPLQLYHEKLSNEPPKPPNEKMSRGLLLEPMARDLFMIQTGFEVVPKVIVKDWAMASLDGMDALNSIIVEIKCPGEKDHALAQQGKIPDYYYPQLQHQMYVADINLAYYFSFDGIDGVIVKIQRDQNYIDKMLIEEKKFYECLINKTPPENSGSDFVERSDEVFTLYANQWKEINNQIKDLQQIEESLRNEIIYLCEDKNTKGSGVSVSKISRKGNVEYNKIPELKNIDLEQYRKPEINCWRIQAI